MSPMYTKIKMWYDHGIWHKSQVHNAVVKGHLTPEEYELIVGEPYSE
jgi:hypothetical protein